MTRFCFRFLADQFFISKAFASERSRRFYEPISISAFAGIESKSLLVQIAEQMKRLYRNISAFDRPLEQRPKVFDPVGVDMSVDVLVSVIDDVMNVGAIKSDVRSVCVRIDHRSTFDVVTDLWRKVVSLSAIDNHGANFAAVTFKQSHNGNLAIVPSSPMFAAFAFVHISRRAADESFVNLDTSRQLVKRSVLHGLADSVKQEPSRLLSDAKRAVKFKRTDTVLRVGDQPDSRQPLVEADRRIFHDRANLDAELLLTGFALPDTARRQVRHFAALAGRAFNAIRPSKLREKVSAVLSVRKIDYGLLQSLRECGLFLHGESMVQESGG